MTRLAAMVSDSALKKAPVTPERNASGAKMMMVEAEEPASGRVNSRWPPSRGRGGARPRRPQAPDDVLDHDDGVVDDQPHRRRHAAQRHDVEAHVQDVEQQDGGRQHAGDDDGGDEGDLEVAQEEQQDEGRQTRR